MTKLKLIESKLRNRPPSRRVSIKPLGPPAKGAAEESEALSEALSELDVSEPSPWPVRASVTTTRQTRAYARADIDRIACSRATAKSQTDLLVVACGEIVAQLIQGLQQGRDVNLNGPPACPRPSPSPSPLAPHLALTLALAETALKSQVSKDLHLGYQPKLVEIIAAIPEQYKPLLLPKLKAKPVRTASGVR